MSEQKSREKKEVSRVHRDKWWFALGEGGKIFLEKNNGRAKHKGEVLNDVILVQESKSKPDVLKVKVLFSIFFRHGSAIETFGEFLSFAIWRNCYSIAVSFLNR